MLFIDNYTQIQKILKRLKQQKMAFSCLCLFSTLFPFLHAFVLVHFCIFLHFPHTCFSMKLTREQALNLFPVHCLIKNQLESIFREDVLPESELSTSRPSLRRRKERIDAKSQSVLNKCRDEASKERRAQLKARVRVDFDKPRLQRLIDHEIHAQQFKVMLSSMRIQQEVSGFYCIYGELSHLWQDTVKEDSFLWLSSQIFIQVCLKFLIAHLIASFILAVIIRMFLDSIIGEMSQKISVAGQ